MIIRGNDDLAKKIVSYAEIEKNFKAEGEKIQDRYDTAANLKLEQEMENIEKEAHKFNQRYSMFVSEKVTVMTIYIMKHHNFSLN